MVMHISLLEKQLIETIEIARANSCIAAQTSKSSGTVGGRESNRKKKAKLPTSVLIAGNDNVGRMTMISDIAANSHFEFVRVVKPRALVGMLPLHAQEYIISAFTDALRAPFSLLVLEDLDKLIKIGKINKETA